MASICYGEHKHGLNMTFTRKLTRRSGHKKNNVGTILTVIICINLDYYIFECLMSKYVQLFLRVFCAPTMTAADRAGEVKAGIIKRLESIYLGRWD